MRWRLEPVTAGSRRQPPAGQGQSPAQAPAQALAEATGLRCALVPEWLRQWCDRVGRTPRADQQAQLLRVYPGQQTLQGVDLDQRYIAVEDQHGVGTERRQGLGHGVACAQLFVLQHEIQVIGSQSLANQLGTMSDHHVNTLGLELAGAVDNMAKHRVAGDRVQYLGHGRAHACALACRENNDIERH